jgi:uncharacterized protein YuzE
MEMVRRNIPVHMIQATVSDPEQRLRDESRAGRWIYQSRFRFDDGKMYLVRVIMAEEHVPAVIVTVYRTQQDRQILERPMKLVYDPEVDVLSVQLSDAVVAESDQDKPGIILDYDRDGNVVSLEILDASKHMTNPLSVEYAITPPHR